MKKIKFFKAGLTLLEVMIALAIFAIAGIAGLQSCLVSTRYIQIVNDEKNLVLLSRIKLEELKTGITDIEREKNGTFPAPFEGYQWEIGLTDITIADTEYGVTFRPYKLTIKTQSSEYSTLTSFLKLDRENEKK
ncbi:MAG: prepilin-type N-terminal cleavage/methylation domain-containing protein [Candidatus Omnitrophica bacterium]|nr:prepilin-type N-terminal cleavage/methylation domain-containing protein [Candidatus Omnitrophota bacterium]